MEDDFQLVDFDIYCKKCKYKDTTANEDPCCECLDYGANEHTNAPVNFEGGKSNE